MANPGSKYGKRPTFPNSALHTGRIIAHFGHKVVVEDSDGKQHRCAVPRSLKNLVCGDQVRWQMGTTNDCVVREIRPRESILARPDSRGKQKTIAANIHQILIITAPQPALNEGLIDRYLVAAEITGMHPVIVLNKIDLLDENELSQYRQRLAVYADIGYPLVFTSTKQDPSLSELINLLKDHTSILVGQSGVGKSSLLNRLLPEVNAKVGEVSESTGKGRHTTTTARLYPLAKGGALIDSPGVREFGLWRVSSAQLAEGFREIKQLHGQCRFRDCLHKNEPGCAVLDALAKGNINRRRYQSYLNILESIDNTGV